MNSKNLPGELYATIPPGFLTMPMLIFFLNVLIDFLKNVVPTVSFSVSTDAVPYL